MGKQTDETTNEVGLTDQHYLLQQAAHEEAERTFNRLLKKLRKSLKKTCEYLEQENAIEGSEPIHVMNSHFELHVWGDPADVFNPTDIDHTYESATFTAWVQDGLAIVPELQALIILAGIDTLEDLLDVDVMDTLDVSDGIEIPVGEVFGEVIDLVDLLTGYDTDDLDGDVLSGRFEADRVQPLLDWFELLRSPDKA